MTDDPRAAAPHPWGAVGCLPLPGGGATGARLTALEHHARTHPLASARLLEGHTDALAIIAEAGRSAPSAGVGYGVWASQGSLRFRRTAGGVRVSGRKPFCSGLGIVDRALVTAYDEAGENGILLDIAVGADAGPGVASEGGTWATPALAESRTGTLVLTDHEVRDDEVVGTSGWYLSRPGFWHGACAPAACWAGGAAGLLDTAEHIGAGGDPHREAALGRMRALTWASHAMLLQAGSAIDQAPEDAVVAERVARSLRHAVERNASGVSDALGEGFGPRPFVADASTSQRLADLHLYLRQDHGSRDLAALGALPAEQ